MAGKQEAPGQGLHFSSPQEEALLSILRSADCLHRGFQHRLKPHGLTTAQYNVLRILRGAHPKGLICSAIARMMITPEPDITRLLGRLKAQKLVTQQRDLDDGRVVWTHLSRRGIEVLAALENMVDQAPKDMLRGLNCEEVGELIRLLGKAQFCGGNEVSKVEQTSLSEKRPLPHLPRSSPLRHHPE